MLLQEPALELLVQSSLIGYIQDVLKEKKIVLESIWSLCPMLLKKSSD